MAHGHEGHACMAAHELWWHANGQRVRGAPTRRCHGAGYPATLNGGQGCSDEGRLRRGGALVREAAASLTGAVSGVDGVCDAAWTGEPSSTTGMTVLLRPAGEEGVSEGGRLQRRQRWCDATHRRRGDDGFDRLCDGWTCGGGCRGVERRPRRAYSGDRERGGFGQRRLSGRRGSYTPCGLSDRRHPGRPTGARRCATLTMTSGPHVIVNLGFINKPEIEFQRGKNR
jgi:hypothetical protein